MPQIDFPSLALTPPILNHLLGSYSPPPHQTHSPDFQFQHKINTVLSEIERLKERHRGRHAELDREVTKMTRADKKQYVKQLADQAEEVAAKNDLKTL